MTFSKRIGGIFRRDEARKETPHTDAEIAEAKRIIQALHDVDELRSRPSHVRAATEEERIVAAWANLAIEEPSYRLEDARRAHNNQKERAAVAM